MKKVYFKKLDPRATIPRYMTPQSAGMDLTIILDKDLVIQPGDIHLIPTGLAMEMPPDMEAQIRPRSGLSGKYPNYISNSPGTVDADYRGQIQILFINNTKEPITIKHGTRMAQMIISRVDKPEIVETDYLTITERGEGGYGHTGL